MSESSCIGARFIIRNDSNTAHISSMHMSADLPSLAWTHCNGDISRLPTIRCTGTCCLENNNGKCSRCDVWETEEHFLLNCPSHAHIRARTFGRFLSLYATWQEPVTLKSLLFPPLCFSWKHRKMILSNVVVFALETGRFKRW